MRWPEPLLPEAGDAELRAGLEPEPADEAAGLAGEAARVDALATLDEELDVLARHLAENLGDRELRAESEAAAAEPGDEPPALRVFATLCALGWALCDERAEATLRQLGVDPGVVHGRWLPELEAWAHARTGALLAAGHYEAARALSDLKIRCLSPLRLEHTQPSPSAPAGDAGAGPPAATPSASGETGESGDAVRPWGARGGPARWTDTAARADPGREPLPETPPSELPIPPTPEAPRRRARRALSLALVAALVAVAAWWLQPSPGSVEILDEREIAALSPHLATGYRDVRGTRGIFIGTVAPSWSRLERAERIEAGRNLERRLAGAGVAEVMLFDRARRLTLHLRDGRLRHPAG